MFRYLKVKRRKGRSFEIYFRAKKESSSKELETDLYIKRSLPLFIYGCDRSGKSENLQKLIDNAPQLWRDDFRFLVLRASSSMVRWCCDIGFSCWMNEKGIAIKSLNAAQRHDYLIEYCMTNKLVIFVDDLNKLSEYRLDILRQCAVGNMLVATAHSDFAPVPLFIKYSYLGDSSHVMLQRKKKRGFMLNFQFFQNLLRI